MHNFIRRKIFLSFVAHLFLVISFSQIEKGDESFKKMDFHRAIQYYLKAIKKKKGVDNPVFLAKLGDAYRYIKDYSNAATYFRLAIQKGSVDPDVFLHDGMILKSTGQFEEAETQFKKCLELRPGDFLAQVGIVSCQEIKKWKDKPKEYEVKNLDNLNSNLSEFSPVVWNGKLVFAAERQNDLIDFSEYEYNGHPFLDVYQINLQGSIVSGKPVAFSQKINTPLHEGPVCFSKDGKTIYFSRVNYVVKKGNNEFINRAKIYFAEISGKKIKNIKELKFDSDEYSVAHPSISEDGSMLFFSSDKPGGYGGYDIYVSNLVDGNWSEPVNLGPDINTVGNEEFPFLRNDGTLYFSSDGLPGFGGMDIFSASQRSGKWILRRNEGLGLNDITDDFGIFFTSENKGFFSSDRAGGRGADDIYSFSFEEKSQILEGYILNTLDTSNVAADQKIFLIDSLGNVFAETRTNKKGFFKFSNLESDKNYLVRMDEEDATFSEYPRYYFADKNGNVLTITEKMRQGKFVFSAIKFNQNTVSEIEAADDIILAGNMIFPDSNNRPMANKKLVVKDEKNHIIDEVVTNSAGSFAFRKLPAGHNYVIEIVEEDTMLLPSGTKILLANKEGKEIRTIITSRNMKFQFKVLQQEKGFLSSMTAEDKDLLMDLSGFALSPDKAAIPNTKIYLLDENGNKVAEILSDKDGKFVFKNLPANKKYILSLDTDDPNIKEYEKVFIADKSGKVVRELSRLKQFQYNILAYEKAVLSEMYVDDSWISDQMVKENNSPPKVDGKNVSNKDTTAKEVAIKKPVKGCQERLYVPPLRSVNDSILLSQKILFEYDSWNLKNENFPLLDLVVEKINSDTSAKIIISAHSDSRGDDINNLRISEFRAKSVVSYLTQKGVLKDKFEVKCFGEMQLLSPCCDDSPCSEEMHAANRRVVLEVYKKKN